LYDPAGITRTIEVTVTRQKNEVVFVHAALVELPFEEELIPPCELASMKRWAMAQEFCAQSRGCEVEVEVERASIEELK